MGTEDGKATAGEQGALGLEVPERFGGGAGVRRPHLPLPAWNPLAAALLKDFSALAPGSEAFARR